MLSAEASHVVTGIPSPNGSQGVCVGHGRHARDLRASVELGDVMTVPLAGQLGHGMTASIRCQPVRILAAVLAAYDRHLGLTTSRRRS